MISKPPIPYRAILSIRNPRGVLCRLPMIAHGMDADEAKRAAIIKATNNGHDVVGCGSVTRA